MLGLAALVVLNISGKRLNKKIALKADKRRLPAGPEQLRQEDDALKNLNHSYIPQVYDSVQENGVVLGMLSSGYVRH